MPTISLANLRRLKLALATKEGVFKAMIMGPLKNVNFFKSKEGENSNHPRGSGHSELRLQLHHAMLSSRLQVVSGSQGAFLVND